MSEPKRLNLMFYSSAEALAVPLLMLVATPLLLKEIGEERFGLWVWINAAASICNVFNFGFSESLLTLTKIKTKQLNVLFMGNFLASLLATFSVVALSAIVSILLSAFGTGLFAQFKTEDLQLALVGATAFFSLRLLENTVLALFKADLAYAVSSAYSFCSKVFGLGIQIFILLKSQKLAYAYIAGAAITGLWIALELFHVFLKHKFKFKLGELVEYWTELKQQRSFLLHSWLQNTATLVSTNIDKVLVGSLLSPTVLAYYSIGSLLINQIHLLFSSAFQLIVPEFSLPHLSGPTKQKRYKEYMAYLLVGFFGLSVLLYAQDYALIRWWLNLSAAPVIDLLPYFLFFELFFLLNIVPYYVLVAARKLKETNSILVPLFIVLTLSTSLLAWGIDLYLFISVRAGLVLIASIAFQVKGLKLIYARH